MILPYENSELILRTTVRREICPSTEGKKETPARQKPYAGAWGNTYRLLEITLMDDLRYLSIRGEGDNFYKSTQFFKLQVPTEGAIF